MAECHLEPFNGQRRITDFYASSLSPVTNTNQTSPANNVGPVDQSDSDSDKTVPWDSSCDPPNGYIWTARFLDELRISRFGETTQSPLEPTHLLLKPCFKKETDSE